VSFFFHLRNMTSGLFSEMPHYAEDWRKDVDIDEDDGDDYPTRVEEE
jgi:hypothetical protein